MTSEKTKMLTGRLYDPNDALLVAERFRAHQLCHALNQTDPADSERKSHIQQALFGKPISVFITPPFHCDYGYNLTFGENVYFNFNCVALDVMPITIGSNVLFGPGVHLYTATHPLPVAERRTGLESAKPITIGDDIWIGGGVIVCPGVTIGSGSVIGAGSVVTRDIPSGVVAAGNPCRVLRTL